MIKFTYSAVGVGKTVTCNKNKYIIKTPCRPGVVKLVEKRVYSK